MQVVSGGDLGFETLIRGPGGGSLGGSYADIVAVRNGRTFYVNTVDTLADGVTSTPRELAAANNIRALTGGHVILIPKGQTGF
jgi:hypothetical protein